MQIIRKKNKKYLSFMLTVVIMLTSSVLCTTYVTADDTEEEEIVKVAPENMLNVQVTDKEGNPVNDINASLKNAEGITAASWKTGSNNVEVSEEYEITGGKSFILPLSKIPELVNLQGRLQEVWEYVGDISNYIYDDIEFNSGEAKTFGLDYFQDSPTELTVEDNTFAIVVDPSFSERIHDGWFKVEGSSNIYNMKACAGSIVRIHVDSKYDSRIQFGCVSGAGTFINKESVSNESDKYIKKRVRLSDLSRRFNKDGTMNDVINPGTVHNFRTDTNDSSAVVCVTSGSVVNIVAPDEDGYVEIYLESNYRKFHISYVYWNQSGHGGSGIGLTQMFDYKQCTLKAVDFPEEGTTLSNIPIGNYTLELSDIPLQYKQPEVQNITIEESEDVQYIKVILEDKHIHISDESEWLSDETEHWHNCKECDGDVKLDSEQHDFIWITDKEATEDESGSKHEECKICEYKKETIEIPALKPTEQVTEKPTTNNESDIKETEETTKEDNTNTHKHEEPTQKQEHATQEQSSEKQSAPVTGDSIPFEMFTLFFTGIVLFGGIVVTKNRKKVL